MLAAVAVVAAAAFIVSRRTARQVRDARPVLDDIDLGPIPGVHSARAPREVIGAWVQFLRSEIADAANALNNRLSAISGLVAGLDRARLNQRRLPDLDQIDTEIQRANAITAGLLKRVSAFAPDTVPETASRLADAPVAPATILLVEDDSSNREVITRLLTRLGHEVIPTRDGLEAWEALEHADVDCIVCDIRMPGLGGRSLFEQAEELYPHLAGRFVFVTGDYTRPETREFLEQSGCPVVPKPYTVDTLLDGIVRVLTRVARVRGSNPSIPPS